MGALLVALDFGLGDWFVHVDLFTGPAIYSAQGHSVEEALCHPQCYCIQSKLFVPRKGLIFVVIFCSLVCLNECIFFLGSS